MRELSRLRMGWRCVRNTNANKPQTINLYTIVTFTVSMIYFKRGLYHNSFRKVQWFLTILATYDKKRGNSLAFYSVFIGTLWSEEILHMDPSRRGLYLLWHYIKYHFLINFFQDVTEGVSNSKNQASSFQSSSNNKDIATSKNTSFPKRFNQWTPRYTPTISLGLQKQLKKYGSIIIHLQNALLRCRRTCHSRPRWRTQSISGIQIFFNTGLLISARCDWHICRTTDMLYFIFFPLVDEILRMALLTQSG